MARKAFGNHRSFRPPVTNTKQTESVRNGGNFYSDISSPETRLCVCAFVSAQSCVRANHPLLICNRYDKRLERVLSQSVSEQPGRRR